MRNNSIVYINDGTNNTALAVLYVISTCGSLFFSKVRDMVVFGGANLAILLTVLWIYLPILIAAPRDVVALNFFFDTLLFSGAILVLADAMEQDTVVARAPASTVSEAPASAG